MENVMLNKILEEVKSLRTEMNERFEKVDNRFEEMNNKFERKFEEMDNKFEGLNDKFEGLNAEVKGIKIELKQLRKDFERHDRGEKIAWEDFEKSIGKEFEELRKIVEKNGAKVDIIGNGLGKIYEEYKIAEESEKYQIGLKQE